MSENENSDSGLFSPAHHSCTKCPKLLNNILYYIHTLWVNLGDYTLEGVLCVLTTELTVVSVAISSFTSGSDNTCGCELYRQMKVK